MRIAQAFDYEMGREVIATMSHKATKAVAPVLTTEDPQYVTSFPRPGDALILQGERLNVMLALMEIPNPPDLVIRGYKITAPITADQKEAVLLKFHNRLMLSTRRTKDEGLSDHLNASLLDARAHMGTINNPRIPVTPSGR